MAQNLQNTTEQSKLSEIDNQNYKNFKPLINNSG